MILLQTGTTDHLPFLLAAYVISGCAILGYFTYVEIKRRQLKKLIQEIALESLKE
tara:strand:+ start:150 stop:314 length:165 start_codon:yes stop_codon:yes gene_type:complete